MGGIDAVIAQFASRQHGVVSHRQLQEAGVSWDAIKHRLAQGRLTRIHRGVYRVGAVDAPLTSPMAAVLACGPNAVLSYHAAAALHGIRPRWRPVIDVTVTAGQPRQRDGLRIHRSRSLETTVVQGIRATTVPRTLLDLATELPTNELRRAIDEAQIQRQLDHLSLVDAVVRAGGHRGAKALRAMADEAREPKLTRSEAERRLLELIEAADLPRPETNTRVAGYEVDFLWRDAGLVIEVDGFAFHSSRDAFERDRRKQADLAAAGLRVSRITWRQLVREREAVVARLARALSAGRAFARPRASAAPRGSPPDPPRS